MANFQPIFITKENTVIPYREGQFIFSNVNFKDSAGTNYIPGLYFDQAAMRKTLTNKGEVGDTGPAPALTFATTVLSPGSTPTLSTEEIKEGEEVVGYKLTFNLAAGPAGATATVKVNSTATGEPGTNATVANIGTDSDALLNFVIPRGDPGSAASIQVGTVTSGETANVINSGTSSNAVFDFVLPKGDKGNTGSPGADAGFGTPTATVQTLPAGSEATVTVTASGENTEKVFAFAFGIPKGQDGTNVFSEIAAAGQTEPSESLAIGGLFATNV